MPAETVMLDPPDYASRIAEDVELRPDQIRAIIELLDAGATVPFVARYRKEATGGADDLEILRVQERVRALRDLFDRKVTVLQSIHAQGKLTPQLRRAIEATESRAALEDLYLPFRPKRRTRATMAKEKGLEPLADRMQAQRETQGRPEEIAREYVDPDRAVNTTEEALAGAKDIVAERIAETAEWRAQIRALTFEQGSVQVKAARGKAKETSKFSDYYDYREPVARIASHRLLAILRGEREGFLSHRIQPDPERAQSLLRRLVIAPRPSIWANLMREACDDAYDRLLNPQIATDVRGELKSRADAEAIEVFASNLRDLLMAPPFGARPVLAIDPGMRTGCKVVVLDATGRLLDQGLVHPTKPREDVKGTERHLDRWLADHPDLGAIAVGNGTGGRETFAVVRRWAQRQPGAIPVVLVNESGASVYSASEVAREELPDEDVTVRGAVSIGRRLQDPLAELVKIDPRSIGVGQYQHDVDAKQLERKLAEVVEFCVNQVGVDLNTASVSLLRHVSGLGPKLARAIVAHRDAAGTFNRRKDLLGVSGLGARTFELAAGFLRVKGGDPLDDSAVHPERYPLVQRMAKDLGRDVRSLVGDRTAIATLDADRYLDDEVGRFTLADILSELEKPGLDPRRDFDAVEFRDDVVELDDLRVDMVLQGVVTNVTHFGAFVDVGVHQDGLVHVSQIADRFVRDPADELHVGQKVRVRVLEIDLDRRRIALSIKNA